MTLPFADKPELSRVYADLKTKTLSQITSTELDALKESIFTEGVNGVEDELRRLLLVQLLTTGINTSGGSGTQNVNIVTGGPMDAAQNINVSDTTGSGNPQGVFFRPADGEVFQITGFSIPDIFNASQLRVYLSDDAGIDVEIAIATQANKPMAITNEFPIFVTHDVYLKYIITSATGNVFMRASVIQTR